MEPRFVSVCVYVCVHLPSREEFHEVVANTLESGGKSDPAKRGNEQDY